MFLLFRNFDGREAPDNLALTKEEIRHVKARRLGPGAEVHFGDGVGRRWSGRLEPKGRWKRERSRPETTRDEPGRVLCTALPEGRRWDWLLQKAVELGVTRIQPVNYRRSVRREINPDRAHAVIVEAAAQSRRYLLPEIASPLPLPELAETLAEMSVVYGLHYETSADPAAQDDADGADGAGDGSASMIQATPEPVAIIVGPEGGFETEEVAMLRSIVNYREVRLGENVMRVETAGVAMLARLIV